MISPLSSSSSTALIRFIIASASRKDAGVRDLEPRGVLREGTVPEPDELDLASGCGLDVVEDCKLSRLRLAGGMSITSTGECKVVEELDGRWVQARSVAAGVA